MSASKLNKIDVSKLSATEIDTLFNDCRKELETRKQKTDAALLAKYNKKYAEKWVRLKGLHTYDDNNAGYRLVAIKQITSVYHQDDAKKYNLNAEIVKMYTIRDKNNVTMVECFVPPTKAWCDTHIEIHPHENIRTVTKYEVFDKVGSAIANITSKF